MNAAKAADSGVPLNRTVCSRRSMVGMPQTRARSGTGETATETGGVAGGAAGRDPHPAEQPRGKDDSGLAAQLLSHVGLLFLCGTA